MKDLAIAAVVFLLLFGNAARLEAQGVAASFDQLSVLVKPGDTISVVDVTGTEAEGRIGKLSIDTLTLMTSTGPRQFGENDVARIRQRRDDSLQNGAIIGAAAGAGYGVAMLAILASFDDGGGPIPAGVVTGMAVFTGVGAAAGAGIDALIKRRETIYQRRAGGAGVSVSPLLHRGRRGAAITVTF